MAYRPPQLRAADAQRARELRKQHSSVSAVARAMEMPRSTVSDLLNYPDTGGTYKRRIDNTGRQYKMCRCGRRMAHTSTKCVQCWKDKN